MALALHLPLEEFGGFALGGGQAHPDQQHVHRVRRKRGHQPHGPGRDPANPDLVGALGVALYGQSQNRPKSL